MTPTPSELKKTLLARGFEVYRTLGDQVVLADRVRDNLIMDSGVAVRPGEVLAVRFIVRARPAISLGKRRRFVRARPRSARAEAPEPRLRRNRRRAKFRYAIRGTPRSTLDTWYEVAFERPVANEDELEHELRYALALEKNVACRAEGRIRPLARGSAATWLRWQGRDICARPKSRANAESLSNRNRKRRRRGRSRSSSSWPSRSSFAPAATGPTGKLARECAVAFDGYCVDAKEYYAAHGMIVPRERRAKVSKKYAFNKQVLDGLVERELLVAEAKKLGLGVGEDALEADLMAGRVRASLPADSMAELSLMLGLCPRRGRRLRLRARRRLSGAPAAGATTRRRALRLQALRAPDSADARTAVPKSSRRCKSASSWPRACVTSCARACASPSPRRMRCSSASAPRPCVRSVNLKRDWFAKYAIDAETTRPSTSGRSPTRRRSTRDWASKKADWTPGCSTAREIFVELPPNALDDEKQPVEAEGRAGARARRQGRVVRSRGTRECRRAPTRHARRGPGLRGPRLRHRRGRAEEGAREPEARRPVARHRDPRGYHVLKVAAKVTADKLEHEGRHFVAKRLYARFAADEALAKFAEQLITRAKAGEKLEEATRALWPWSSRPRTRQSRRGAKKDSAGHARAALGQDRPRFEVSPPFNASGNPLARRGRRWSRSPPKPSS